MASARFHLHTLDGSITIRFDVLEWVWKLNKCTTIRLFNLLGRFFLA